MGAVNNIKAIIWDMGGVILRSEHYDHRDELAARFHVTERELEQQVFNSPSADLATLGLITQVEHWTSIARYFGMNEVDAAGFEEAFWAGDRCDQDLVDYIRQLRPRFKTGLLSNAWMGTREVLRDQYHCLDAFDVAVFSYEVGLAKPDAGIYNNILAQLKVAPAEAVFVDDFQLNVKAAQELGMFGIHFHSPKQVISEIAELTK
jgi:epoxide hydrolase-like predicted phosphatase